MILFASQNPEQIQRWRSQLGGFDLSEKQATDKRELYTLLAKLDVDTVLVELSLLGKEGIDEISALHELKPSTRIIILTDQYKEREEIFAVLFGARAYIEHSISEQLLHKVVTRVQEGEVWVDRRFVGRLIAEIEGISKEQHEEVVEIERGIQTMTPRESEIAELIATGASNRRIAEKLSISERTVKAHLGVIFKKIGINDRLQLALYMNKYHQLSSLWHTRRSST